jgi:hypothetical protein
MQEFQELIENLFHNRSLGCSTTLRASGENAKKGASGSQSQARALNYLARSCDLPSAGTRCPLIKRPGPSRASLNHH